MPTGDGVVSYSEAPGLATVNARLATRRYQFDALCGDLRLETSWKGMSAGETRVEVHPDSDGNFEVAIDEFWSTWIRPEHREGFEHVLKGARNDFTSFRDSFGTRRRVQNWQPPGNERPTSAGQQSCGRRANSLDLRCTCPRTGWIRFGAGTTALTPRHLRGETQSLPGINGWWFLIICNRLLLFILAERREELEQIAQASNPFSFAEALHQFRSCDRRLLPKSDASFTASEERP